MTTPTRFVNLTPHDINVYAENDVDYLPVTRKWVRKDDTTPILTIPCSGRVAQVKYSVTETGKVITTPDGSTLPIWKNHPSDLGKIEYDPDVYIIVSMQYAIALREIGHNDWNVLTVKDTVADSQGKPVGCLGFYTVE